MGIYPEVTYQTHTDGFDQRTMHVVTETPGLKRTVVWVAVVEIEDRTDCFCCSCDNDHNDPSCRNHGWWGRRPCEYHSMPGETDEDGAMPRSVESEVARIRAYRERDNG